MCLCINGCKKKKLGKSVVLKQFFTITKKKECYNCGEKWVILKKKLGHSIIADPVLRKIEDYFGKRVLYITEKEKQKYKSFFKAKKVFLLLKNLLMMKLKHVNCQNSLVLEKNWGIITII